MRRRWRKRRQMTPRRLSKRLRWALQEARRRERSIGLVLWQFFQARIGRRAVWRWDDKNPGIWAPAGPRSPARAARRAHLQPAGPPVCERRARLSPRGWSAYLTMIEQTFVYGEGAAGPRGALQELPAGLQAANAGFLDAIADDPALGAAEGAAGGTVPPPLPPW